MGAQTLPQHHPLVLQQQLLQLLRQRAAAAAAASLACAQRGQWLQQQWQPLQGAGEGQQQLQLLQRHCPHLRWMRLLGLLLQRPQLQLLC